MKLLLDACVWGGICKLREAVGHDVVWAGDWPSDPGEQHSSGSRESLSIRPTFKIVPGPPEGHSYAIDLACRFGISKEQLISTLVERGEPVASS